MFVIHVFDFLFSSAFLVFTCLILALFASATAMFAYATFHLGTDQTLTKEDRLWSIGIVGFLAVWSGFLTYVTGWLVGLIGGHLVHLVG